ncbi:MAG: hypothetical protein JSV24_08625 [Bacteroidales bacterium]|nr:MAG: hypothetical protein JSV24_08625 [Bacteroidales bacterium]
MKSKSILMIKLVLLFVSVTILSGCGTTRMMTKKYVGSWEYKLETPDGTYEGAMVINYDGETFTGIMESDMGSAELDDLKIEEGKLTASLDVGGYILDIAGEFVGDEFTGTIGPPEFQMPFNATRVEK